MKTNRLNDLEARDWLKFQKSWFVHNPPRRKKDVLQHPAKFPETLAQEFIEFFTKQGGRVLDPMVGTGTTLVACLRAGRHGVGIELNPDYAEMARKIVQQEREALGQAAQDLEARVVTGDAGQAAGFDLPQFDYLVTSPPYWDMLRMRGAMTQKKRREDPALDVHYSDDPHDLGNITDYDEFLERLVGIYAALNPLLKPGAYLTIIVKNVKKRGKIYPLAWDIGKRLGQTYALKDEKIWCLPPEERVWTENGPAPIGDIAPGQRVLAHTGQLEPVTQVLCRNYQGELIKIRPALPGGAVRLTPEHEVLVLKRREYHHADGVRFFELFARSFARGAAWIPAGEVREGDAVAFPIPVGEVPVGSVATGEHVTNKGDWHEHDGWLETWWRGKHGRGRLPAQIRLDNAFLRLAGWYLSEGSSGSAGVCISNNEAGARQVIRELFTEVFGASASDDGKKDVWCRSRSVGQVLGSLFGRVSHEKHLPADFWHLSLALQTVLLSSLWQGDGHVSDGSVTYKTVSEDLALGVAYLSIRLGAVPYIQRHSEWLNLAYRGQDANRMREILRHPTVSVRHCRSQHWIRQGIVWLPVRSVQREIYNGEVCNLTVANANSYTAIGFTVHNCQDSQRLAPYGLGSAWVSNTFHHYCLQFQKAPRRK